jgi:hypothetical protein
VEKGFCLLRKWKKVLFSCGLWCVLSLCRINIKIHCFLNFERAEVEFNQLVNRIVCLFY